MELSKINRLALYATLKKRLKDFSNKNIENGVMLYCLTTYSCDTTHYDSEQARIVANILQNAHLPTDLETVIEFFEALLEKDNKDENGIVFTPQYIAEYITKSVFEDRNLMLHLLKIIDPGCGCGIFLVAAAEYILKTCHKPIDSIIRNNIYGIDIDPDNVRRCILILRLLSAKHGGNFNEIQTNIICRDSLKINWTEEFDVDSFSLIIGNPPYVNPHDINKETVQFLKKSFITTQSGVFNIFYAFIEKGLNYLEEDGILSFIIPNNFLTIKSAFELRRLLQTRACIRRILDFGHNMVFKPVRTYNCIVQFTAKSQSSFEYYILPKVENIENAINKINFSKMLTDDLDKNGWKLVDERTYRNLRRIESQLIPIKEFIRTGIATLRDRVYLVERDNNGFYKNINSNKCYIENDLVKPIYKIPDLKLHDNIDAAKRYIIFPYIKTETGYTLIAEFELANKFPKTYECLLAQRDELDARDKGKGAAQGWYAYGRTQGLNKYGKKLLFSTFANRPRFIYVDDEDALFCNGYAVFDNDRYELDILQKVLNSRLMQYYVSNTSYSIEGGYYCYQKKYVERFSVPLFTKMDIEFIRASSQNKVDDYLWTLYGLE